MIEYTVFTLFRNFTKRYEIMQKRVAKTGFHQNFIADKQNISGYFTLKKHRRRRIYSDKKQ